MGEIKENVPSNIDPVQKISCDKASDHSKKNCGSKKLNLSSIKSLTPKPSTQLDNFVINEHQYLESINSLKNTQLKHEQSRITNQNSVQISNNVEKTQAFSVLSFNIVLNNDREPKEPVDCVQKANAVSTETSKICLKTGEDKNKPTKVLKLLKYKRNEKCQTNIQDHAESNKGQKKFHYKSASETKKSILHVKNVFFTEEDMSIKFMRKVYDAKVVLKKLDNDLFPVRKRPLSLRLKNSQDSSRSEKIVQSLKLKNTEENPADKNKIVKSLKLKNSQENPVARQKIVKSLKLKNTQENPAEKKWCHYCDFCKRTYNDINGKFCSVCSFELTYRCNKCEKSFKKYLTCYMHTRRKCYPADIFNCNDCSYTTYLKSSLRNHIQLIHLDSSQQCPRCQKELKNSHSLRSHLEFCGWKIHRNCSYCSFKTLHKYCLKRHILRHHTYPTKVKRPDKKCFKCDENIRSIISHKKNCGKHRKFFHCDLCQYKQSSKWNLENHLRTKHPQIWSTN